MRGRVNLVAAAFALTATSYGLARFAYGLLLPDIRAELSLSAASGGWIGGGAFAAYCLGIAVALLFDARLGPRRLAVLAGLFATAGMALVSIATSGWSLGLALALAGLSTGLTSPPLAVAVARCFDGADEARANGAINAGTAAGIVLSGVAVLSFAGGWRGLYALFAALGAAVTLWLWFAMPAGAGEQAPAGRASGSLRRQGAGGLCASAFLAGIASTAIWTFGADILRREAGFTDGGIALAWIVLGAAGAAGAGTGVLTSRYGIGRVHRLASAAMSLALIGLGAASLLPAAGFSALGLFGTAYIVATGAFLLWGIALYPDRPAFGLGLPFLVLALGQAAGAPLFGTLLDLAGSAVSLAAFAALMAGSAIWTAAPARADRAGRARGSVARPTP